MIIKYECEYCHMQFNNEYECRGHEILHLSNLEELKYHIRYIDYANLCLYCDNAYYVYGSEFNCPYKDCNSQNNYKYFKKEEMDE